MILTVIGLEEIGVGVGGAVFARLEGVGLSEVLDCFVSVPRVGLVEGDGAQPTEEERRRDWDLVGAVVGLPLGGGLDDVLLAGLVGLGGTTTSSPSIACIHSSNFVSLKSSKCSPALATSEATLSLLPRVTDDFRPLDSGFGFEILALDIPTIYHQQ